MEFPPSCLLPSNLSRDELELLFLELKDAYVSLKSYVLLVKMSLERNKQENMALVKKNENLKSENRILNKRLSLLEEFMHEREKRLAQYAEENVKLKQKN